MRKKKEITKQIEGSSVKKLSCKTTNEVKKGKERQFIIVVVKVSSWTSVGIDFAERPVMFLRWKFARDVFGLVL